MKFHRTAFALVVSMLLGLPITGQALDTDVYLNAQGVSRDDSPNVLIILDNSGSMTTTVTTRPAYDPSINYASVAGAPSPQFDNTRIYWTTSSSPPSSASTGRWFLASNNMCTSSQAVLASGGTGIYGGDTVVDWANRSSTTYPPSAATQGSWSDLSSGRNGSVVECKADNPADASLGTYLASGRVQYQNRYTNTSGSKLNWSSFSTVTLYNANYLNYFNNSTLSTSDTRMNIAKNAIKAIIDGNQNVRFGLMVFNTNSSSDSTNSGNHGGRVIFKIDTMDAARRTAMKNVVDNITATTWTPLAETMWEARTYLGGLAVDYGNNDTSATPARDTTAELSGTYISPLLYSCQKAYIILVTDGDPTYDENSNAKIAALSGVGALSGSYLDELTAWMSKNDIYAGKSGVQSAVTYTVGFGTGISAAGLQLLKDAASKSGGKYYAANDADELSAALQGTLIDVLQTTTSFAAPALSVNAFNTLFNRDEVYFAVFKPSNSILWDGNIKKYTLCKDKSSSPSCTYGEIIDRNGTPAVDPTSLRIKDTASSYWGSVVDGNIVVSGGAGAQIPAPSASTRKVYTYTGTYGTDGRTPTGTVNLTATVNAVDDTNAALTAAMLNVSTATERTDLINWILGMDVRDANANGDTTEQRWALADPTHSRPVAVTYGGTNTAPIVKLFVGTNDGMLRMINENTGKEEWAFLPQELLGMQEALSQDTNGLHKWGVDGTPTFHIQDQSKDTSGAVVNLPDGIIDPSIGDFVHVIIGMRRGGNNYYALDVTPSAKLTSASSVGGIAPKLLWVIRGGSGGSTGYTALGQTWSKPNVAKIRYGSGVGSGANAESASKTVLIFGGGYDANQDNVIPVPTAGSGNAIFIADVATGERLWWASGASSGANLQLSGMDYSIPSDLALMDANGDSAIDRIYVGDVSGQVWRVDLSPTLRKNNGDGTSGARLADLGCKGGTRPACTGTALQDRRKFYYPPNVAQVNDSIFSTTAKYDIVTLSSGDREDPLDNLTFLKVPTQEPVHNRIYALRDYKTEAMSTGGSITYNATLTDADLYDATSNTLQGATSTAITSSGIKTSKGWFIELKTSSTPTWEGEKGMARTVIYGGTLFATTYIPANANTATLTCAANEGLGHLYALNILDATADIDFDKSGTLTTSDRHVTTGGGIPSELVTVIREGGVTGLVGPNQPQGIKSGLPREKTYWFQ